jgi:hypothetical protein
MRFGLSMVKTFLFDFDREGTGQEMKEFSRLTQAYALAKLDGNANRVAEIRAQIEAIPYETRLEISLILYNRMIASL